MVTAESLSRRRCRSPLLKPASRGWAEDSGDGLAALSPPAAHPGWSVWAHDSGVFAASRPSLLETAQAQYRGHPPPCPVIVVPVEQTKKPSSTSTLLGDAQSDEESCSVSVQTGLPQFVSRSDKSKQKCSPSAKVAEHTRSVRPSSSPSPVKIAQYVASPPTAPVWVIPILPTKMPSSRPLSASVADHQVCEDTCGVCVQAGRPRVHSCQQVPNQCCARALMNEHVRRAQRHLRALSKLQRLVGDIKN